MNVYNWLIMNESHKPLHYYSFPWFLSITLETLDWRQHLNLVERAPSMISFSETHLHEKKKKEISHSVAICWEKKGNFFWDWAWHCSYLIIIAFIIELIVPEITFIIQQSLSSLYLNGWDSLHYWVIIKLFVPEIAFIIQQSLSSLYRDKLSLLSNH